MARTVLTLLIAVAALAEASCIRLKADPIQIDLNVRIDQEVRVRLEDDVNELITNNPDLF